MCPRTYLRGHVVCQLTQTYDTTVQTGRLHYFEPPNTFFVKKDGEIVHHGYDESEAVKAICAQSITLLDGEQKDAFKSAIDNGKFLGFGGVTVEKSWGQWRYALSVTAYFCPRIHGSAYFQDPRHLPKSSTIT
jgi:hypothetical protein